MPRYVGLVNLGLCRYRQALLFQESVAEKLRKQEDPSFCGVLILVEHPPVYTFGIRKEVLKPNDIEKLKNLGADVEYAGRGGLVTFHGPGQLVAWPVLDLKRYWGIRKHVYSLEESVIETCSKLGLTDVTRNKEYPGVWRGEGKLCAVGVRASRFITTHGLALNVSTDLSWFNHIIPCGIEDKQVISLSQELHRKISVQEIIPSFLESFSKAFSSKLVDIPDQFNLAIASH